MSLLRLSLHGKCHSIITALFSAGSGTRPRLCLNTTPQGKKNLLSNHPTGPQDKVSFPPAEPNVLMIRSPLHLEPCSHSAEFFFFFFFLNAGKEKEYKKRTKTLKPVTYSALSCPGFPEIIRCPRATLLKYLKVQSVLPLELPSKARRHLLRFL